MTDAEEETVAYTVRFTLDERFALEEYRLRLRREVGRLIDTSEIVRALVRLGPVDSLVHLGVVGVLRDGPDRP